MEASYEKAQSTRSAQSIRDQKLLHRRGQPGPQSQCAADCDSLDRLDDQNPGDRGDLYQIYARCERDGNGLNLAYIPPTATALWQEIGGSFRIGTWDLADAPGKKTPSVTVDTYFGVRYTYLDLKLDFDGVFRGRTDNVSEDKSWVEPLLGVRTIWDLSEQWTAALAGDIGGVVFGSDFAWNAMGLIGYRFNSYGGKLNA